MPDVIDKVADEDIFDQIDLPVEEKVVYSEEMQKVIAQAVEQAISKLPIEDIISKMVKSQVQQYKDRLGKEFVQRRESEESLKSLIQETVSRAKLELNERMDVIEENSNGIDADAEKLLKKMGDKYDDLVNKTNYEAPQYQFGGYPPPGGGLPLPGNAGLMEWRFIVVGDNLSVQKLESGTWTEKASFNP